MKLLLLGLLVFFSLAESFVEDPDYRPAFHHRARGGSVGKYRVGVQIPQSDNSDSVEENAEEDVDRKQIREDAFPEESMDSTVYEMEEERIQSRSRRDVSDEVNDGPGGTFEVKDSTDGQEGDDTLVELTESRYGDSDGQDGRSGGRFRRMLLSSDPKLHPKRRGQQRFGRRCEMDSEGNLKCFMSRDSSERHADVPLRSRRDLQETDLNQSEQIDETTVKDVKPWRRAMNQWRNRKFEEEKEIDEDKGKNDSPMKRGDWRRKPFRRRCTVGQVGKRRCLPRPERPLKSPRKENRERHQEGPLDLQL